MAAAYRTEGRHIMSGALGCPACRAHYPIEGGIADFTAAAPVAAADVGDRAASELRAGGDLALKLAALLDLTDTTGYVVLLADWAQVAHPLRALVPVPVLLVNPPPDAIIGDGVSAVRAGRVPVLAGSARGVALHAVGGAAPWRDDGLLASALHAVRPGGRVVAPRSLPAPAQVTVLADDESHWVATHEGVRPLLQIVRAPR